MHPLAPILCASLPGTVCAVAHYIPWRHWFRRGRLPRPLAYAVGLLSVLLPATVAAWLAAERGRRAGAAVAVCRFRRRGDAAAVVVRLAAARPVQPPGRG